MRNAIPVPLIQLIVLPSYVKNTSSSVTIVTRLLMARPRKLVSTPKYGKFSVLQTRLTDPPVQGVSKTPLSGVTQPGREVRHSSPSSAEVTNA